MIKNPYIKRKDAASRLDGASLAMTTTVAETMMSTKEINCSFQDGNKVDEEKNVQKTDPAAAKTISDLIKASFPKTTISITNKNNTDGKNTSSTSRSQIPPDLTSTTSFTSFNLPIGERLPSRNISFGLAEILTIPEVYHRFRKVHHPASNIIYQPPSRNSNNDESCNSSTRKKNHPSIRVTGVVLHRVVHDDASVSLILGDPLANLHQPPRPRHDDIDNTHFQSTGTKRKLSSAAENTSSAISKKLSTLATRAIHNRTTPDQQTSTIAANTTDDTLETNNHSNNGLKHGILVKRNSLFTGNKKRNLVYVKRNHPSTHRVTLASPSSDAPKRSTMSTTVKSMPKNISSTAESPLTLLIKSLLPDSSRNHCQRDVARVWVVSDPEQQKHQNHPVCNVNDLVMVMGEVQTFRTGTKRDNDTATSSSTKSPNAHDNETLYASDLLSTNHESCAALRDILPKLVIMNDDGDDTDHDEQLFYVQARIVCIANGTHMKLHTDALQVRRAFLERQQSVLLSNKID